MTTPQVVLGSGFPRPGKRFDDPLLRVMAPGIGIRARPRTPQSGASVCGQFGRSIAVGSGRVTTFWHAYYSSKSQS
jgi:hypothetical protein